MMEKKVQDHGEKSAGKKNPWDKRALWPEELNLLRAIIAKTELEEMTKWGGTVYTLKTKNVVGIGGFKEYVAIWFWNGVFMKDRGNHLIQANQGVTRGLRQWRFSSKAEIEKHEDLILEYLREAIGNEKAGLSIKPEKKQTVISEFFQKELDADKKFAAAFSEFTPGKQREFLEFIDSAKRGETKIARMEKIKPMVLDGIGLNDKYR